MGFAQHYRSEGEQVGLKKGILIGEEKGILIGEEKGIEKGIPQGESQIFAANSPAALARCVSL